MCRIGPRRQSVSQSAGGGREIKAAAPQWSQWDPKQKFWQQFDPSTADVIVLNLTGIWNEIEEQVSIEKYIEAMEVWLSYTKGRSFLILYLRNEQVEKAAGLHILSWTLIDPIISVTGIDMKAFIFRRDFDV